MMNNEVLIIIPENAILVTEHLKLCEIFLTTLSKVLLKSTPIKIEYESKSDRFICKDPQLKQVLTIISKGKMLDDFYQQLSNLFLDEHILKVRFSNKFYRIAFNESGNYPDFTWVITYQHDI